MNTAKKGILRRNGPVVLTCLILIGLLMVSMVLAINFGPAKLQTKDIIGVLGEKIFGVPYTGAGPNNAFLNDIVWELRVPRILLGMIAGAGLALCGCVMQAVVKNPLANPYILGISSGASLGATAGILLGFHLFGYVSIGFTAFLGALISSYIVYIIAHIGGRTSSVKLLLAGMAVNALCSAFSSFIVYVAADAEGIQKVTFWLMGSLASGRWHSILPVSIVVLLSILFFLTQFRGLNLLLMGDEVAISLGTDLNRIRKIYLLIVSLIVGMIVWNCGTIGFVGLIIPHVVRMFVGTDHRKLIPISVLVGALFLLWCDVVAKIVLKGVELPIGIITSMIGSPLFIYLMVRKQYGFGRRP